MNVSYPFSPKICGRVDSFNAKPPIDPGEKTPGQTPFLVIYLPVIIEDRDGEQTGEAEYIEVKRRPSATILSRFGVSLPSKLGKCVYIYICITKHVQFLVH